MQPTASCQLMVLVLQLFASARFQGHPSEKLAGKQSFKKWRFFGDSFSLLGLCFEVRHYSFNRSINADFLISNTSM